MKMRGDSKVLDVQGRPGEPSAFSIHRGELARTTVHGAELQECGIFGATAKSFPKEA